MNLLRRKAELQFAKTSKIILMTPWIDDGAEISDCDSRAFLRDQGDGVISY